MPNGRTGRRLRVPSTWCWNSNRHEWRRPSMAWISRMRALFGRDKLAREQAEELEFHLSMREQLNVEQGMTQAQARRDARRRFGNPHLWRERMSEIDLMILPQTVLLDLRYGARILWRNMGFTIAAVL